MVVEKEASQNMADKLALHGEVNNPVKVSPSTSNMNTVCARYCAHHRQLRGQTNDP